MSAPQASVTHLPDAPRADGGPAPTPLAEDDLRTGARLSAALLVYYVAVVGVVTLLPFRFSHPTTLRLTATGNPPDFVANIALFVPLGFLFALARHRPGRRIGGHALGAGLLISGAIEIAQLFEPDRFATLLDILANGTGAWIGAILYGRIADRIRGDRYLIGRLFLELPLMGLVYLLVPLLWLGGLSASESVGRVVLMVLPGLFGGSLLASVQIHRFGPAGILSGPAMAGTAAAWMLVGTVPALLRQPVTAGFAVLVVAAFVGATTARATRVRRRERRFETTALRRAIPYYATYLGVSAVLPLLGPTGPWSGGFGVPGGNTLDTIEMLRRLESAAAFTLLGYTVAEIRGRLELPYRASIGRVLLWATAVALPTEGLRGFGAGTGASLLWLALTLAAALFGGWIYHLQRAHVRRLIA